MTKEEKIKGLYSLKEYLVKNSIELEGHKSLPITLIDYAIEALEQEPKSEWEQDHAILKAHSDGANEVLDKIRAEILKISSYKGYELGGVKDGYRIAIVNVLNIIDKYKRESEDNE